MRTGGGEEARKEREIEAWVRECVRGTGRKRVCSCRSCPKLCRRVGERATGCSE